MRNLRLHERASFSFGEGVTLIWGPNARGKTSLLEAIFLLMTGRSFRTNRLTDLFSHNSSHLSINCLFHKQQVEQSLLFTAYEEGKKILHNRTPLMTNASLIGILQGVVMTPDDIALVKGGPLQRRRFLDFQLAQADPIYLQTLLRYHRAMRHRNALLRQRKTKSISCWEEQMAEAAEPLTKKRRLLVQELASHITPLHHSLFEEAPPLTVSYQSQLSENKTKESYLEQLEKSRERECSLGSTLIGPHRDDLIISLSEREARYFGSEGEQRAAVSLLRLAEWEWLREKTGDPPLLLVDDIAGSLDRSRRRCLLNALQQKGQVLLTATEQLDLGSTFSPIKL